MPARSIRPDVFEQERKRRRVRQEDDAGSDGGEKPDQHVKETFNFELRTWNSERNGTLQF
jgi:hypothetical protein